MASFMSHPLTFNADALAALSPEMRQEMLSVLSEAEMRLLETSWEFWARHDQLPPPGDDWFVWLICAGRGWG